MNLHGKYEQRKNLSSSSCRQFGDKVGNEEAPKGRVDVVITSRHVLVLSFGEASPSPRSSLTVSGTKIDSPSKPTEIMRKGRPADSGTKGLCPNKTERGQGFGPK